MFLFHGKVALFTIKYSEKYLSKEKNSVVVLSLGLFLFQPNCLFTYSDVIFSENIAFHEFMTKRGSIFHAFFR